MFYVWFRYRFCIFLWFFYLILKLLRHCGISLGFFFYFIFFVYLWTKFVKLSGIIMEIECTIGEKLTVLLGKNWMYCWGHLWYLKINSNCYLTFFKRTLWARIPLRRGALDPTLCDTMCQWHTTGRWFSPDTPVSSTNKTDRHELIEILLEVALNTITSPLCHFFYYVVIKTWNPWGN